MQFYFTTLVCLTALALYGAYRFGQRKGRWLVIELATESQRAIEDLREARDHAQQQWNRVQTELGIEARKAAQYFAAIEGILGEKQVYIDLYTTQAIEHGNAQNLLMDAIQYLHGRLAAKGETVPLPSLLAELVEDFREKHVIPVTLPASGPTKDQTALPSPTVPDNMSTEQPASAIVSGGETA